jgi:DNA-binding response OmpR family regulator
MPCGNREAVEGPAQSGRYEVIEVRDGGSTIPVLIMTGHAPGTDPQAALDPSKSHIIHKPFDPQDLWDRIAELTA